MEERRANIGKREDRRVRRTKHLLEQGLVELLAEKPIKSITVRELTDRVDINRGTFYLYYRDIYDMVEKLEQEYLTSFMELAGNHQEADITQRVHGLLVDGFTFVQQNKGLCRVLLGENGDMVFLQKMDNIIKERCRMELSKRSRWSEVEFEYRYSFGTLGIMGVIKHWLENDCADPLEKVARLAQNCLMLGVLDQV